MRQLIFILSLFVSIGLFAQTNSAVSAPAAYNLPDPIGIDYVYIFRDLNDCFIEFSGVEDIYRMEGSDSVQISASTDSWANMENNTGYIVHTDTSRITFWVLDYSQYRINELILEVDMENETHCNNTKLMLRGLPEMSYCSQSGEKHIINRECEIEYTTLSWGGEEWQDSVCVEKQQLRETIIVGAPLCNTTFNLKADQIAIALGIDRDSLVSEEYQACAVAAHPTTVTTIRGTDAENQRSNELERPIEETQLTGSAPLDIFFKANGNTPVAQYYKWQILKGNDLIAQRTDESHRYVFDDFGVYRVLLWVSNDQCQTDSVEITVSVSTSQLLVPNVFTPNGDGRNDEFRVMYRSLVEFECWIYNRWGKLVYHWTDPAKGWDGTINGRPAAEGAYFYVIRAKGADADATGTYHKTTKKKPASIGIYQLSGDINLIRGKK